MHKVVYVIPKRKIGGAEILFNEIDQYKNDEIDLYKYDLNTLPVIICYHSLSISEAISRV